MSARYPVAARALHWLVAAIVLAVLVLGPWMTWFAPADGAARHRLYNLHESFGVVVLALMLMRVGVRWAWPPPRLPAGLPPGLRAVARVNHAALYALLLAMPVLGYLTNSAEGVRLMWFEALPLPVPLARDPAAAQVLGTLHLAGAALLAGLIALHLAGALHGAFSRPGLARRMF